ncbi:MAG: VCBS repeat-containing protein, partial [Deltaproteobacteria bacterium]|nr:VCBS repeat-containing protein [Deltaproteobacteria bacterium]
MRYLTFLPLFLLLLLSTMFPFYADAQEEKATIVVLPFEVSRTGQYAYLNSAIRQMLMARLVKQGAAKIVDPQLSAKEVKTIRGFLKTGAIDQVAARVKADWLVDGSMYSLKEGLQVNLTFYSTAADIKPIPYTLKADKPDDILPAITALSAEINSDTFGLEDKNKATVGPTGVGGGLASFQTPHPERDYKKGLYSGATLFGGGGDERFESKGIRKSSNIPLAVESVALGDLNNDGVQELVVASRTKIRLFHFDERRFDLVAQYDLNPNLKIHVINIADPGVTGTMKLFVSANNGKFPASAIFTWDGSNTLTLVRENIRWYIRPVWWPKKEMILAGQKDSPNISDNFLAPGVFQLNILDDSWNLKRGEKLQLPEKTDLFDFVVADLNGDGSNEMMVIDKVEKLLVYDDALNLLWVSSANYGGSKTFFGPPKSQGDQIAYNAYNESENALRTVVFIPGRLDTRDITGDGLPEVVVSSNEVGYSKYAENIRSYDGGSVACLSWRGAGLMELWR